MNYRQACLKRSVESIVIFPFVLLGKVIGKFYKLNTKSRYFLFFPSADIGGSPKVNADILFLLQEYKPVVIFSKKAKNNGFKDLFYIEGVCIIDLSRYIDNKLIHFVNFIFRGIITTWINQSEKPIIFGGECMYFYKIVQHVKSKTRIIELSHLNTWINFNQAYIKYLDHRIVSTPKLKRYLEKQYTENKVPECYAKQIQFIDNWVEIPPLKIKQNTNFNVLFVGRGAPQKRVHIISNIAEDILKSKLPISFTFVGDVLPFLSENVKRHATIFEQINDKNELNKLYDEANVLILTSAYEGLPIVVMDMMARGKVVLSTAVDGIPDYIVHMKSGLLISELIDENKIKTEAVELLTTLVNNPILQIELGMQARTLAEERFSRTNFENAYKRILEITS